MYEIRGGGKQKVEPLPKTYKDMAEEDQNRMITKTIGINNFLTYRRTLLRSQKSMVFFIQIVNVKFVSIKSIIKKS